MGSTVVERCGIAEPVNMNSHTKRDSADVVKDFEMGRSSGLSIESMESPNVLKRENGGKSQQKRGGDSGSRVMRLPALKTAEGVTNQEV